MTERERIKGVYPKSKKWAARVDKMPDAQVHAIFMRFQDLLTKPKDSQEEEEK